MHIRHNALSFLEPGHTGTDFYNHTRNVQTEDIWIFLNDNAEVPDAVSL